jgi:hypothetical protein
MNKDEAWKIIESCKGWNVGQQSILFSPAARDAENKVYDARREALTAAWKVVGEKNENI